jgi:hypothetical protein
MNLIEFIGWIGVGYFLEKSTSFIWNRYFK